MVTCPSCCGQQTFNSWGAARVQLPTGEAPRHQCRSQHVPRSTASTCHGSGCSCWAAVCRSYSGRHHSGDAAGATVRTAHACEAAPLQMALSSQRNPRQRSEHWRGMMHGAQEPALWTRDPCSRRGVRSSKANRHQLPLLLMLLPCGLLRWLRQPCTAVAAR